MNKHTFLSVLNISTLCIIISITSFFIVGDKFLTGLVLLGLGCLCLVSLLPFRVRLASVQPDIIFGLIDNGILAIFALFGAHFAGVSGAILGGVVGNAITDGIAGIFEGHVAERLRLHFISDERTMLKSAVGKMAGCLFGAGIVFLISALSI